MKSDILAAVLLGAVLGLILGIGACLALIWGGAYLIPGLLAGAAGLGLWLGHRPARLSGVRQKGMESRSSKGPGPAPGGL